ncbi:hypothetical protein CRX42_16195 [Pseudomonas jessenii]|uniref:Uncharacterized protein n=1 Tax=Pseudomonas jessenii TaxID=77298 RepID=A0A2W0EWI9_PSEJE|nr:hypothetical protein CRX42_16195 [Pseudomonas jessenii]
MLGRLGSELTISIMPSSNLRMLRWVTYNLLSQGGFTFAKLLNDLGLLLGVFLVAKNNHTTTIPRMNVEIF